MLLTKYLIASKVYCFRTIFQIITTNTFTRKTNPLNKKNEKIMDCNNKYFPFLNTDICIICSISNSLYSIDLSSWTFIPVQCTLKHFSDPNTHSPIPVLSQMACAHLCPGMASTTCSVGQTCSGFDGLIKRNHLLNLCNMPDKGSFPRRASLYPSKEKET